MNELPVGAIIAYGGPIATINDSGKWKLCNGDTLYRDDYPELYAVLQNYWGNVESPNFKLPDLRGVFIRGVNEDRELSTIPGGDEIDIPPTHPYVDPDVGARKGTNPNVNEVGSFQIHEFKRHNHQISHPTTRADDQAGYIEQAGDPNFANRSSSGLEISYEGGNETRPINAYVHYLIKARP